MASRKWISLVLWGAGLGSLMRCSGSASPLGPNEACFRALDCKNGLVCVQGRCTSDITSIVPEGAGEAPAATSPDAGSQ